MAARPFVTVALYVFSQFLESVLRLKRLAQENVNPELQITLLNQAGNAWLMAEKY